MKDSVVRDKSFDFALRIVQLSQALQNEKHEFVLSKQVLRSGTAIGALIREADQAESKADFVHKMAIALKEANETEYWIKLLEASKQIEQDLSASLQADLNELLRLLTAIIKTAKANK